MKRCLVFTFVIMLIASFSSAADFQPTVMTLTCPETLQYEFDGSPLSIPFTIAGTPAAVWLVINTKGQAESIVDVQNGFLGWHYVNKIDTTVYISNAYSREPGESQIVWEGIDQDGNVLAAGDYDYYLWAFDNQTSRELACDFVQIGSEWVPNYTHIYEIGTDNLPLAKPMLMGANIWFRSDDEIPWKSHGVHFKWELGSDPSDVSLLQTTKCALYQPTSEAYGEGFFTYGGPCLNPWDFDIFYHGSINVSAKTSTLLKWEFVSDGEAVKDEDWMGWDNVTWDDIGNNGVWWLGPSLFSDRNYMYHISKGSFQYEIESNYLRCVDFEGEVIFDKMPHFLFEPDDPNPHGTINTPITNLQIRGEKEVCLLGVVSCALDLINTSRLIEDPDDDTDLITFRNLNGDYFLDVAYEQGVEPAWYCFGSTADTMRRGAITFDSHGFGVIGLSNYGTYTHTVITQDGTGIDYMTFADSNVADNEGQKGGGTLCDNGSNYDGLYFVEPRVEGGGSSDSGTYFVAFDSVHGVITNAPVIEPGVQDDHAAFSVDQNAPNPFNPATTISFTLPEAHQVSVDIYNVAGQKVDTLINDFIAAGKHSIVWNASGYSAGVYFYTVKSGDFSQTMKMTLLK